MKLDTRKLRIDEGHRRAEDLVRGKTVKVHEKRPPRQKIKPKDIPSLLEEEEEDYNEKYYYR